MQILFWSTNLLLLSSLLLINCSKASSGRSDSRPSPQNSYECENSQGGKKCSKDLPPTKEEELLKNFKADSIQKSADDIDSIDRQVQAIASSSGEQWFNKTSEEISQAIWPEKTFFFHCKSVLTALYLYRLETQNFLAKFEPITSKAQIATISVANSRALDVFYKNNEDGFLYMQSKLYADQNFSSPRLVTTTGKGINSDKFSSGITESGYPVLYVAMPNGDEIWRFYFQETRSYYKGENSSSSFTDTKAKHEELYKKRNADLFKIDQASSYASHLSDYSLSWGKSSEDAFLSTVCTGSADESSPLPHDDSSSIE